MDNSFPAFQFQIGGYSSSHGLGTDRNGDRTITFTRHPFPDYIKGICVEINLGKVNFYYVKCVTRHLTF